VVDSIKYLYREGYEQFKSLKGSGDFFKVVHCTGEVNERGCSSSPDKKRIYMDLNDNTVYSVNTQYAGNTVAFKKLSLRLAISKASKEGWLAEHMLVMGVKGPGGRKTYFLGAFPSFCGKTSTAMIPGESILGDDLAYLKVVGGRVMAANVEKGIFGVIKDVNPNDDPLIWKLLTEEGDVIFSNVAVDAQNLPRWLGDKRPLPAKASNHLGAWTPEDTDAEGKKRPICHQNARYTVELHRLGNVDSELENPNGVEPKVILYGGRDEDTTVPVEQAFDWAHGVATKGAIVESVTTAAIVGQAGVRVMDPFANKDFISIPIGRYVGNHLKFVKGVAKPPQIFSVNYFLKSRGGEDLTDKTDKKVWLKWAELRVHGDVGALETPTGCIPKYEDLKRLFKENLGKDFSKEKYDELFTVRIPELLAKLDRGVKMFKELPETPKEFFELLEEQRQKLERLKAKKGDYVIPDELHSADWKQ
ncbi:MAG: phosphoenolpyruvate carboxykinase (GTP), partial [Candidatus Altiarchaeales archaeon]|nr:phosphoenolpyruvate carboxykinase (GTP) [Candidatus Altiarchaeales archaeon]